MEKQPQKFSVPDNLEDSSDFTQAPLYFKKGNILNEISKSKNQAPEVPIPSSSIQNEEKSGLEFKKTNVVQTNLPPRHISVPPSCSEFTSRLESEFAKLKQSEFFEKIHKPTLAEPVVGKGHKYSSLLVNSRQRGNPLLKYIRNVPYEFSEIEPDYIMGKTVCALFLSLRYHNLFPNYIHERLKALGKAYELRVLLVQVDVAEPNTPLKDLSVISILADCSLMVTWSPEEAGSCLEAYKMYEHKPADWIKETQSNEIHSQLIDCLTTIRAVNKTDAMVLLSNFKTLKNIIQASIEDLSQCPGIGPLKGKRIYDALRKPLKNENWS